MRFLHHALLFGLLFIGVSQSASAQSFDIAYGPQWKVHIERKASLNSGTHPITTFHGTGTAADTTLFFIHGLGSYSKAWEEQVIAFGASYNCLAIDLPGYGRSELRQQKATLGYYVETILAFINASEDRLRLKKIILVGHSMGGQIAVHLAYALQAEGLENLIGLVLIDPAGFETFTEAEAVILRAYMTPERTLLANSSGIEASYALNFSHDTPLRRAMVKDRLALRGQPGFPTYARAIDECVDAMLTEPLTRYTTPLQAPTLVLYGNEDRLIPNKYLHPSLSQQQVFEQMGPPMARKKVLGLAGCGHFLQADCPNAVNNAIAEFIAQLGRP